MHALHERPRERPAGASRFRKPQYLSFGFPKISGNPKTIEPGPPPDEIKRLQLVQDSGDFAQKAQGADLFIVLLKRYI